MNSISPAWMWSPEVAKAAVGGMGERNESLIICPEDSVRQVK